MMTAPSDPIILFSWINTLLRDKYPDLDELCISENLNRKAIEEKLQSVGYVYNAQLNQFR